LRTALVLAEATRAGGGSSSGGKVSTMYSIQSNHRFFDCFTSYNFDMVQILGAFLIFV
jgi:hypothetical protein